MTTKDRAPALGADGWFTTGDDPHLIGSRCDACGTYAFPKRSGWCPSPACRGTELIDTPLSRRGRIWSYTDAQYQPPAPFVCPPDAFEPFAIAAVELEAEGLVVLGQLVPGVGVNDVKVGDEVELAIGVLFADDTREHLVWQWRPTGGTR
ncbi:MAG: OB-fold domain-containing protein [Actinobacteria bacterium]|nr:OB-fold domain-containing protein [Actinomycetota bacterium]